MTKDALSPQRRLILLQSPDTSEVVHGELDCRRGINQPRTCGGIDSGLGRVVESRMAPAHGHVSSGRRDRLSDLARRQIRPCTEYECGGTGDLWRRGGGS